MIDRYNIKKISELFSLQNRYKTFLDIELANVKALVQLKVVPKSDYDKIKKQAVVNVRRINEIEKQTKHDLIAFTRQIGENLGAEKRWFHYGLTSSDVVDTAMSVLYSQATDMLLEDIDALLKAYKTKALKYKTTPCIARTHGMHAEITSFGLKFVRFYDELNRNKQRLIEARDQLCLVKLSGAVGNFAMVNPKVQELVAKELKLNTPMIATQIIARDNHTNYLNALALIAAALENACVEFRNLSRNEIGEVAEYFDVNQKGSSAMPHKHNPISFENICGLGRLIKGYAMSSYENIPLYHERDISHSSFERVAFPDAINLTSYILQRMTKTVNELVVFDYSIKRNIGLTKGVVFSERVLTALINKGMVREEAYDLIQRIAKDTIEGKFANFEHGLWDSDVVKQYLNKADLTRLFDPSYFVRNVDLIYKKVGL